MTHEERGDGRTTSVQRRKRSKDQRRGREVGGVHIKPKKLIDPCKTSRRAIHGVIGGRESKLILIPRGRAWESQLDYNPGKVHISKAPAKDRQGLWRGKYKHDGRAHEWCPKVYYAVWKPCKHIKHNMLVGRKNVAQIRPVEHILECRENADPDGRTVLSRNETALTLAERSGKATAASL